MKLVRKPELETKYFFHYLIASYIVGLPIGYLSDWSLWTVPIGPVLALPVGIMIGWRIYLR